MNFIICILLACIFAVLLYIALVINEFLKSNERKSVRKHEQTREVCPHCGYAGCITVKDNKKFCLECQTYLTN